MIRRFVSPAAAALGVFLLAAAAVAVVDKAVLPGAAFAAFGLLHLAVAAGIARGSRPAAVVGAVVGLVNLALVGVGIWFIAGIESAIGVDLNALWFAPLNGYATIGVAAAIAIVSLAMVAAAFPVRRSGRAVTSAV